MRHALGHTDGSHATRLGDRHHARVGCALLSLLALIPVWSGRGSDTEKERPYLIRGSRSRPRRGTGAPAWSYQIPSLREEGCVI